MSSERMSSAEVSSASSASRPTKTPRLEAGSAVRETRGPDPGSGSPGGAPAAPGTARSPSRRRAAAWRLVGTRAPRPAGRSGRAPASAGLAAVRATGARRREPRAHPRGPRAARPRGRRRSPPRGGQPEVQQARDLGLRERLVGEVGERRAAPERQGLARPALGAEALEPCQVELVRGATWTVARGLVRSRSRPSAFAAGRRTPGAPWRRIRGRSGQSASMSRSRR